MSNAPYATTPAPRKSPFQRILFTFLKLAIAIAGIWYVMHSIHWNDTAVVEKGKTIRTVTLDADTEVRVLSRQNIAPPAATQPRWNYRVEFPAVVEGDAENESGAIVHVQIDDQNRDLFNFPQEIPLDAEFFKPDHHEILHRGLKSIALEARSRWYLLAAAWALLVIPFLVTALRWRALMRPQGINMPFTKSLQLTFVGQFYSILLPGITGGDLIKIVYAARLTGSKTKSLVTVLLDRVIGLVALMCIGGISAAWQLYENAHNAAPNAGHDSTLQKVFLLIAAGLVAMAAFSLVYFSHRLRVATGLQKLIAHPRVPYFIKHADEVLHRYRGHAGLITWAFLISLCSQLTLPISAWLSGLAFGIHMNVGYYLAYVPVAILAASLPISPPQGIGFLEYVLNHFFVARAAATASQAFALTQAVRFLPILWNLVGAYWVVTGQFSRHQALEEEKQMEAAQK